MSLEPEILKNFASEIYALTSKITISNFNNTYTVIKDNQNGDLVTEVDLQIEQEVKLLLEKYFPEHKFWGEEIGGELEGEYVWALDPLDGTNNYGIGLPLAGTILTLFYKNEAIFAFISYPFADKWYCAIKDHDVYVNGLSYKSPAHFTKSGKISGLIGYEVAKTHSKYSSWLEMLNKLQLVTKRVFETWAPVVDFYLLFENKIDAIVVYENELVDTMGGILIAQEMGFNVFSLTGDVFQANKNLSELVSGVITIFNQSDEYFKNLTPFGKVG